MSAKLSPIIQTKSGTTSPQAPDPEPAAETQNTEIGSNTIEKKLVTTDTQMETEEIKSQTVEEVKKQTEVIKLKSIIKKSSNKESKDAKTSGANTPVDRAGDKKIRDEKSFSSDSLVQHVHNLENPSEVKSIDPIENKLEREYRKMFATKSKEKGGESSNEKPIPDFKSTSLLRRRFDALRRSLGKKDDSKKNVIEITTSKLSSEGSGQGSCPSHRDVSVTSDPPSLEERSYSNTKIYKYNPYPEHQSNTSASKPSCNKSYTGKKDWSRANTIDSEYAQGVKGMFKLWGKKFNLEEDYCNSKKNTPGSSFEASKKKPTSESSFDASKKRKTEDDKKKPQQKEREPSVKAAQKQPSEEKKEGKKFFFFNKKSNREKPKETYKPKKGVTTGRCEVRDGLVIKIGAGTPTPPVQKPLEKRPESYDEILRKTWLMKYLTNPIESKKSVQVRWNNKTYTTSSSTVFELMENVYKETGIIFKSKSEIADESSFYRSYTKQNVNFVQNVEAWMIPKMITDQMVPEISHRSEGIDDNIKVSISDQKWFIEKSKAFAHKIEVVLHSNNFVKLQNPEASSEYLRIDIPKGFFSDTSSDDPQQPILTSDEEVYKIVEYDISNSKPELRDTKNNKLMIGDNNLDDIQVTISVQDNSNYESKIMETVIKRPPMHRDVVIQGSNVYIPKKCDVIGVGIITQRDVREVGKPM